MRTWVSEDRREAGGLDGRGVAVWRAGLPAIYMGARTSESESPWIEALGTGMPKLETSTRSEELRCAAK